MASSSRLPAHPNFAAYRRLRPIWSAASNFHVEPLCSMSHIREMTMAVMSGMNSPFREAVMNRIDSHTA